MSESSESGRIRLRVAFRNMFYTTIYAAVEGGFLAAEGLDIDFAHIPAGQSSTDLLKAGAIDITQSGISRSLMDLDAGSADPPQHIAEINRRDGFFLLSRRPLAAGLALGGSGRRHADTRRLHARSLYHLAGGDALAWR